MKVTTRARHSSNLISRAVLGLPGATSVAAEQITNATSAGRQILKGASLSAIAALLDPYIDGGGGGGGSTPVTTTWDPDTSDPDVTLSGGNLTISTGTQASRTWVYSTDSVNGTAKTGFKLSIAALGTELGVCLIQAGQTESYAGASSKSAGVYASVGSAFLGYVGYIGTGHSAPSSTPPFYLLLNLQTRKWCYSYDNVTYYGPDGNAANIATGSNWIDAPTGALLAGLELQSTGTRTATADFDDASWMPDGYVSWNEAAANSTADTGTVHYVTPEDYGWVGDGSSHLLSGIYGSLAEAQAAYDGAYFFLTDLNRQADWAAVQAAAYVAFGVPGGENAGNAHLNKELRLPPGRGVFGGDTVVINNTVGARIIGAGRLATKFVGETTLFRLNGIWYSHIEGFSCEIQGVATTGAMVIDGLTGDPDWGRGVQGITMVNMLFDGGGGVSSRAFQWCPVGGSSGQGSESVFINCHFQNANICFTQEGYNALSNTFIGGNFQNYDVGIYAWGGTLSCYNTAFQAQRFDQAIIVDAADAKWHVDINIGDPGSGEGVVLMGCRTESVRFLWHGGSVSCTVNGVKERSSANEWFASTGYGPSGLSKTIKRAGTYWYTNSNGTTGASEPDWSTAPNDGDTRTDGTITWTRKDVDWIKSQNGGMSVDYNSVSCDFGKITLANPQATPGATRIDSGTPATTGNPYRSKWSTGRLNVECTSGARYIWLDYTAMSGRVQPIRKVDASANAITVRSTHEIIGGSFAGGVWSYTFGGGAVTEKNFVMYEEEGTGFLKWSVA